MRAMQRVVGGRLRGRKLNALPRSVRGVRPTSSKLRSAVFDRLQSEVVGARVLDPFAGTGAVSIEALSRGAAFATLMDRQRAIVAFLGEQLAALDLTAHTRVHLGDASCLLAKDGTPHDILFLDPPYDEVDHYVTAATAAWRGGWLAPGAVVVVEYVARSGVAETTWPSAFVREAQKRYGEHRLDFLRLSGDKQPTGESP